VALNTSLFDSYEAVGIREDVSDLIYNIAPVETPFLSAVATAKAAQRIHYWQIDGLPAVDGTTGVLIEGDEGNIVVTAATALRGTFTQINGTTFGVTGSEESAAKYGRDSEMAYQSARYGRWLKRQVEMACTGLNQQAVVGDNTGAGVARKTASLSCWLTTAVSRGATGANPAAPVNGIPTGAAAVDGTQRALTTTLVDDVMQLTYDAGGKPSLLLAGPRQRTKFSALDGAGIARRADASERRTYGVSDLYASNFGDLVVVTSRHMRKTASVDRELYVIDPELVAVANFRPWQQFDLAKTGDSFKRQMLTEWALEMRNEAGHCVVADLTA